MHIKKPGTYTCTYTHTQLMLAFNPCLYRHSIETALNFKNGFMKRITKIDQNISPISSYNSALEQTL